MDHRLLIQSLTKYLLGVVIIGLLLFLPAGSLKFWQAWLLMGILLVPMFCAGLVMMAKNPELLRKRLNAKEEEKEQQTVVKLSGLLFVAAFVVAGLNWRFGWCVLPDWAVWVSAGLFLFLAMPLVLASPISFLIMLLYIPLIARRIKNEEMVLEEGLKGYKEYKLKVQYKVIPVIW